MFTFKNLKVSAVFIAFNVALLCLLVQTIKSYSPLLYFCMWLLATLESINIIFIIFQWAVAKNITVSRETKEKCIAGQTINVTINIIVTQIT
ncbi:MAG: hypothetical protein KBB01_04605 [Candidatus Omnitrophica bacterium]|nr:hypothetical protein [Candidatus Omnitrophota bacterium]